MSVVIGAYNPGRFLQQAIGSVLAQSYTDWECAVVDDGGSEDLTWVEQIDPRVHLLWQANQGVAAARNRGVAETSASLVAFLDADDVWMPEKLEAQVAELQAHPSAPACSTDFDMIDEAGRRIGAGFGENFRTYRELLLGCGICLSTAVVRRRAFEAVGGFNPRYRQVEDWDLWLRLVGTGELARVEEVLVSYRQHSRNASRNYRRLLAEGSEVLHGHAGGEGGDAAVAGLRRLRRLAGAQAFDAFRETRRPRPFLDALRLYPIYTVGSTLRWTIWKLRRSARPPY